MNSASRYVHRNFVTKFSELSRSDVFYSSSTSRRPKKGDPSSLNVTALPIIKREVKNRLSHIEVCCLQDYELETYVIEVALIDYSFFKGKVLDSYKCRRVDYGNNRFHAKRNQILDFR